MIAESAIGNIKKLVNKPKAQIHIIAGLAPETNNDGCFACSVFAFACS